MADFLTRLAERTLGLVPVVRPLIAPEFASDPIHEPPDPGWDAEAGSSDDLTHAPQKAATKGPSEHTVVEPPGEQEAEVASSAAARTSTSPRLPDLPNRTSIDPARTGKIVDTRTRPPGAAREPGKQAPDTSVGETQQNRHAPDESRSAEASAPDARASLSPRSVVDTPQGERAVTEPDARAGHVETVGEVPEVETAEQAARELPRSREYPSRSTPGRAARAAEIATVVPAMPARRDHGRSDEVTVLQSAPAASSDDPDPPSRASSRETERHQGLLPGTTRDEREGRLRADVSPPTSATPNRMLVKPTMKLDAHPEGGQRQSSPLEPIIRVNIGRVEVRAAASPPPRQQAAKPARLSLDDYLHSRGGGPG